MKQLFNLYFGFIDLIICQSYIKNIFFNQINILFDCDHIQTTTERAYIKDRKPIKYSGYYSIDLFKTKLLYIWCGLNDTEMEDQLITDFIQSFYLFRYG